MTKGGRNPRTAHLKGYWYYPPSELILTHNEATMVAKRGQGTFILKHLQEVLSLHWSVWLSNTVRCVLFKLGSWALQVSSFTSLLYELRPVSFYTRVESRAQTAAMLL